MISRHTILPAVRWSRPCQRWQSEVWHTCQAGKQQNDGECCALRRHGGQRLQQLVGAARWFDTQGSGGKCGGWRLAIIVASCERTGSFHVQRVPSRARQQYWRHRDVTSSPSSGRHVEANRCIQEPVYFMDGSGSCRSPKSSPQCLSDLKHARKNAKVISCPSQPIPAILMCATMRWQLESNAACICAGHSVSIPAGARCGVKACARPLPMPLQPVCRHCRCRLATAVLWRCRHY